MKIAFVVDSLDGGGIARVCSILASSLVKYCDVVVYDVLERGCKYKIDSNVVVKNNCNISSYFLKLLWIARDLKSENVDKVILMSMGKLSVLYSLVSCLILNKTYSFCCEHIAFSAHNIFVRILKLSTFRYYDNVVFLTSYDATKLSSLLKKSSVKVMHNPSPFMTQTSKVDFDRKIAISIGHLIYRKGFDRLISIWALIARDNPSWQLYIIGSGPERDKLQEIIVSLGLVGSVYIIEETSDIEAIYSKAAIYLSASRSEGLPMTFIEAMSFGIPVISYDVQTGPSELIDHGRTGFLVNEGDENGFVSCFNNITRTEGIYEELSHNSRVKHNAFEKDYIVKKWCDLLGLNYNV